MNNTNGLFCALYVVFALVSNSLFSSTAFASSPADTADLEVSIPGEYSFEVSQAKGEEVILSVKHPISPSRPKIHVKEEFGSLECELWTETIKFDQKIEQTMIYVSWSAGADYSGCVIEIRDDEREESALVQVYMSY